jgi:hypothetical protein
VGPSYLINILDIVVSELKLCGINIKDDGGGTPHTKKTKTPSGAVPVTSSSSGLLGDDAMRTHWKNNTVSKVGYFFS